MATVAASRSFKLDAHARDTRVVTALRDTSFSVRLFKLLYSFLIAMDCSDEMKRPDDVGASRPRITEYSFSVRSRTSRRTTTPSSALMYVFTCIFTYIVFLSFILSCSLSSFRTFSRFFPFQRRSEFESLISESSDEDDEAPAGKLARLSLPKIGNDATNPKEADTVVFEDMDEARLTATFTLSSHPVVEDVQSDTPV